MFTRMKSCPAQVCHAHSCGVMLLSATLIRTVLCSCLRKSATLIRAVLCSCLRGRRTTRSLVRSHIESLPATFTRTKSHRALACHVHSYEVTPSPCLPRSLVRSHTKPLPATSEPGQPFVSGLSSQQKSVRRPSSAELFQVSHPSQVEPSKSLESCWIFWGRHIFIVGSGRQ